MSKTPRFGTGMGRHLAMSEIAEHAAAAEQYGYEHLTILDDINLTRDVYPMLTVAALSTSKILIGHGVTHPYTRHPVQTAVATATIHEVSGGRAFLGLGSGHLNQLIGLKPATIADMREVILIARALSRGEEITLKNGTKLWSPWMNQPYPIYLAAEGPRSMQLAGELADATWILGFHPQLIKWRLENIEMGAEKAGRSRDDIDIWLRTIVVITDSRERGREVARPYCATMAHQFCMAILRRNNDEANRLKQMLPQPLLDDYARIWDVWNYYEHEKYDATHAAAVSDQVVDVNAIVGTPEECAETIQQVLDAGFDGVSMTVFTHRDKIGFWRDFSTYVRPLLTKA